MIVIYYPCLRIQVIHFIFRDDYICAVMLFTIILLTRGIKSILLVRKLKSLNPGAVIEPTEVSISRITGRKLHIFECCYLLIRNDKFSIPNREFLITDCRPSIMGLEKLRNLQEQIFLLTNEDGSSEMLDNLSTMESNCKNYILLQSPLILICKHEISRP